MVSRVRSRILPTLILAGLAGIVACSSSSSGENVGSSSAEALTALPASVPSWANAANFRGRVASGETVSLQVHLALHDVAGAQDLLAHISDPDDAAYGQYLSDDDFAAKFGPTDADLAAVRAHLEGHGLTVTEVPDNKAYVAVTGTASQVESAFYTQLGNYGVKGQTLHAPMVQPKVPASIGARVAAVVGLAQHKMAPMLLKAGDVRGRSKPLDVAPNTCSEFYGAVTDTTDPQLTGFPTNPPYVNCGYKPAQLREAYGLTDMVRKGTDGTGQKVAIVDAFTSPTLVQDAQTYFANEDADYPLSAKQITLVTGPGTVQTPDTGWYGEQSLDVESVHAIAPGASIVYVGAASAYDNDLIAAINLIITKKLATVVSNSYGAPEALDYGAYTAWQSVAIQAGLKGVGLYFASGDSGDNSSATFGTPTPNFPASLAEVTGVGGTSLGLGATGARSFEVGWEDGAYLLTEPTLDDGGTDTNPADQTWQLYGFAYGAGGGLSQVYLQPSYQKGIVSTAVATDPNSGAIERATPDVAMLADPLTGYLIGMTDPTSGQYGESDIGGTSLATPLFTATIALAQQHGGRKFGFANTLLYKASKKGAFTDITPAASPTDMILPAQPSIGQSAVAFVLDYRGTDNTITTGVGFDTVTGLGVPSAKFFSYVK
jgi:subtilase family serine protease